MKIFISWSGERSHRTAELLNYWIQCVLQAVDPWLSSKDIDRGSLWFSEITNQLSNTHNGIVCLTKSNLNNPWILFEAGALAKGLSSSRVYTFLIDLRPTDIKDPLAQFNHTAPTKDGVYQLVRTINNGLDAFGLKENILSNVFETYWPQFEKEFKEIIKNTSDENVVEERPKEDLLNEILNSVRGIDRRLRRVEDISIAESSKFSAISNNPTLLSRLTPVEQLDFTVRAFNVLKAMRVKTIDDLLNLDFETAKKMGIMGMKSEEEIKSMIEKLKDE